MANGARPQLAHLWQLPLLLVSLGLFAAAAYLFVNPGPGLTLDQKIDVARVYLKYDRPEAALDQLNHLIATEKLPPQGEARIHLMLAETIDSVQKLHHASIASNHERIVEQTRLALAQGAKADSETYRRLGESYEALGKNADALESYRRAMAMDARTFPYLQRKVIELQSERSDTAAAEASIEEYLKNPKLSPGERAWAFRQKAQLLTARQNYSDAKALLARSLRLADDPVSQGECNYRLGYCLWKMGDLAEAQRVLLMARAQLKVAHPLDAEAAYLLGRISQDQNDPKQAVSFYQAVLWSHPASGSAALARLGRGQCRILLGDDAAGLSDLHELVKLVPADTAASSYRRDAVVGLAQSAAVLAARENYDGAIQLLADEQMLESSPPADFFARLATLYQKRADQLERTISEAPSAGEKIHRQQKVRELRTRAGDSWIACSRSLTLSDDNAHAQAMWKGVDLYDRAGDLQLVTSALKLFVAERPDDGQAPEALLRLGRAYEAAGVFDQAVAAFERNQLRYPQSLAASKSGVPLAQAYISKGPDFYARAEKVLLGVLDSPILSPDAEEFGQSLFELTQLYYRTGRYEEAVVRASEMIQRYPNDPRMPRLLFLMADSYRKSAELLGVNHGATPAAQAEALAIRNKRLLDAKKQYDRLVDFFAKAAPAADLDKLYLKLACFYRADCMYDLGKYEEAIKLYGDAATRYRDDASSLSAYVQIANADCELGRFDDARRVNERAKTLLAQMPPAAFADDTFSMPREYWARWQKWATAAGLWDAPKQLVQRPVRGGK